MFITTLRVGAVNVPVTYEIRDQENNLATLTGYDSVRLYIKGYSSSYITATVNSTGNVTVTFPAGVMVAGEYEAKFIAVDNTNDMIPLGLCGKIKVLDTWE